MVRLIRHLIPERGPEFSLRDCPVQSGSGDMSSFGNPFTLGFLPVTAVEEAGGLETWSVDMVEAARVDGDSVGLGTRHVERVHSAMRAECMLGHAGAEGIGRQRVLAAQQFEILQHDGKMEDALLRADGAIAL